MANALTINAVLFVMSVAIQLHTAIYPLDAKRSGAFASKLFALHLVYGRHSNLYSL
jgi:hypothetical protein